MQFYYSTLTTVILAQVSMAIEGPFVFQSQYDAKACMQAQSMNEGSNIRVNTCDYTNIGSVWFYNNETEQIQLTGTGEGTENPALCIGANYIWTETFIFQCDNQGSKKATLFQFEEIELNGVKTGQWKTKQKEQGLGADGNLHNDKMHGCLDNTYLDVNSDLIVHECKTKNNGDDDFGWSGNENQLYSFVNVCQKAENCQEEALTCASLENLIRKCNVCDAGLHPVDGVCELCTPQTDKCLDTVEGQCAGNSTFLHCNQCKDGYKNNEGECEECEAGFVGNGQTCECPAGTILILSKDTNITSCKTIPSSSSTPTPTSTSTLIVKATEEPEAIEEPVPVPVPSQTITPSNKANTAVIAGASVGAAALAMGVCGAVYYFKNRGNSDAGLANAAETYSNDVFAGSAENPTFSSSVLTTENCIHG
eukprot:Pgem_evm1s19145